MTERRRGSHRSKTGNWERQNERKSRDRDSETAREKERVRQLRVNIQKYGNYRSNARK